MDIDTLADLCAVDVHPATVIAIIQVESASNPWAININDKEVSISVETLKAINSMDLAIETIEEIEAKTDASIDVGLMQVNSTNLERFNISYSDAFMPCINIKLGSMILRDFYVRAVKKYGQGQKALRKALSAYNTGSFNRGFTNGYVNKVLRAAGITKKTKNFTSHDINNHIIKYDKQSIQDILNASTTYEQD